MLEVTVFVVSYMESIQVNAWEYGLIVMDFQ